MQPFASNHLRLSQLSLTTPCPTISILPLRSPLSTQPLVPRHQNSITTIWAPFSKIIATQGPPPSQYPLNATPRSSLLAAPPTSTTKSTPILPPRLLSVFAYPPVHPQNKPCPWSPACAEAVRLFQTFPSHLRPSPAHPHQPALHRLDPSTGRVSVYAVAVLLSVRTDDSNVHQSRSKKGG
jgi:hypothetical protein